MYVNVCAHTCMRVVAGPVCDVRAGGDPGADAAIALRASPCGNAFTASIVRGMVTSMP
jgi:hypothetical protein